MDKQPANASTWSDVDDVLVNLRETHGDACVAEHEGLIRAFHAEILADAECKEEFDSFFADTMFDLVGPTNA